MGGRLVRFSADVAALAQAEEAHATITPGLVDVEELVATATAAVADKYTAKQVTLTSKTTGVRTLWADRQRLAQILGKSARKRTTAHPRPWKCSDRRQLRRPSRGLHRHR